ncbi:ATP-binding protein [Nonlabens agnitus]|uniref:ATP-binding protein n=1 Tax=Nonlabens agnitus TaxID=870484 RepID=A0A2S9WRW0_9FLAO|nr:ATP-binding protein [Nonlabens agnitus]PRP66223.1 ATP-binding protein [Nonlabens agnitus]
MEDNTYISADGVYYEGIIRDIKRSKTSLQPIYEAFTNSLEAIRIKANDDETFQGQILIKIYSTQNIDQTFSFSRLLIIDNGIGFNDKEFKRFNTYKDFTKGFKNLGSGRIQFTHYFDTTTVKSVYKAEGGFREREFIVSKKKEFLDNNAITYHKQDIGSSFQTSGSTIIFEGLLDPTRNIYHKLNDASLKDALLRRYIQYFCLNKNDLPDISIEHFVFNEKISSSSITNKDLPEIDKTTEVNVNYSKISDDAFTIVETDNHEVFTINSYKLNKDLLKYNELKLTSKDELIENFEIELQSLAKDEVIENSHFLFLVSSDYLDSIDTNERGEFEIPDNEIFSGEPDIFQNDEVIILDLLVMKLNESIYHLYPQIERIQEKRELDLKKLKEMFLLPDHLDPSLEISINDSDKKILEKFYTSEAIKKAELDSTIKESIERLNDLDTTSDDFSETLEEEIDKIVEVIPQQNKVELTHYVARRKLVLELFTLIIEKNLSIQKSGNRNKDEALLHNLIFQQKTTTPDKSDLWIINEDFIYFHGISEFKLSEIKYKGENIIRNDLSDQELKYLDSLGEKRLDKRPDVLLFPQEEKCIIIEFKNPDVSVAAHLNQINNYATLLRNFAKPELRLTTFYGYLIGEKIEANDVRAYDADFKFAYNFDYLFRPQKTIAGMFANEGKDGSLYTEVLKYSTLLERAKKRNNIFIKKLTDRSLD